MDLALDGKITDTRDALVDQLLNEENADGGTDDDLNVEFNQIPQFGDLLNLLTISCVVDPPLAEEADDTHLCVTELCSADRLFIFEWANREAKEIAPFRGEKEQSMDAR